MWGNFWPYRSTLIKKVGCDGPWQVVELSEEYLYKDDSAGPILECDVDHDILTIMGVHAHGIEDVSAPLNPPAVDIPLVDAEIEVEEEEKPHEEAAAGGEDEGAITVQVEIPEKIYVEGLELSATSSVYDQRRICRFFGINQSGSKTKMSGRIVIAIWLLYADKLWRCMNGDTEQKSLIPRRVQCL